MVNQILNSSLRILFFRAGPQDFPYVPQALPAIVALAIVGNGAVFAVILPPALAFAVAAAMVGAVAMVTRSVLRARNFDNRFNQAFLSLLTTTTLLTLMTLPALLQLAPLLKLVAKNPELLNNPDALQIPQGATFIVNLLNLWNFAVTAHVFRHAADARMWVGMLIAVVAALTVLFVVTFVGSMVAVMLGGAA